jgi:hypothetical protein
MHNYSNSGIGGQFGYGGIGSNGIDGGISSVIGNGIAGGISLNLKTNGIEGNLYGNSNNHEG